MFRNSINIVVLMMILILVLPTVLGADESNVFVHFVVVGNTTNKGIDSDQAMDSLKVGFDELAGGYTEIGPTNGGFMPSVGKVETENNTSFMVSASRDLTEEIEELVSKWFSEKPFILVWPARCNYPGIQDDIASIGEQLVKKVWKYLEDGNIESLKAMMASGFQSIHTDGSRDANQELDLIRDLELGACALKDIKVTSNGDVLVTTYFVSVAETINGKRLTKKPAARMTVFLKTSDGWKWLSHANLKPIP